MTWLQPKPGGTYVDATLGLGGHAEQILVETRGNARVLGLEWDEDAAGRAEKRLARFGGAVEIINDSYANLLTILDNRDIREIDGILLDLGVSSLQLDDTSRGFSFQGDAPLDMRMSRRNPRTASEILRTFGERDLEEILREYGEERQARRIARALVRLRGNPSSSSPSGRRRGKGTVLDPEEVLGQTRALAEFVAKIIGRRGRIHPATRVFQALRIAVNRELDNLKKMLEVVDTILGKGGRALFISFHSLEDRLVKRAFLDKAHRGTLKVLTRKPIVPTQEEISENPRARSAKLRVAEKVE